MERLKSNIVIEEEKELRESMINEYRNNLSAIKYLHKLGLEDKFIEDNIVLFYPFISDLSYCNNCPGLNKCQKGNAHLCTKIVIHNGEAVRELVPCKKLLEKTKFEGQFAVMDFEKAWLNETLKSINGSKKRAPALASYMNYKKNGSDNWIYMNGEGATGKSFIAAVFAVDAAKDNKGPICFLNCAKRFKELQDFAYKNADSFEKRLELYCSCPVLVLDEFGNELKNDLVRDGILFQILSKRSSKHLFTIITSDFNVDEIVELYSTTKAAGIRAKQIGKILKTNCKEEINLGSISLY